MYICKYCGKECKNKSSLTQHEIRCKENINRIKISIPEKKIKPKRKCLNCGEETINDKFCSKSCAASFNNKNRKYSVETKEKISKSVKLYNETHKVQKIRKCIFCKKTFIVQRNKSGKFSNSKFCSSECRNKYLSKINKEIGSGGFREGSVKNYKSGWYKGIHCDSSWELAFVIYHIDNNIDIKRCTEVRTYILNGITKKYFPDFVVNGIIYEIKGINNDISKAKQLYNNDICFLFKNDLTKYIEYVKTKYGSNFIDLYDKKDKK
jgi:hypothetical protein